MFSEKSNGKNSSQPAVKEISGDKKEILSGNTAACRMKPETNA
jgi:hypothetical protein